MEAAVASPRKRSRPNRETPVVHAVREAATRLGIRCWRQNPTAIPLRVNGAVIYRSADQTGERGLSDLAGVCPGGRFIAIEVKTSDGALRPEQELYLDEITRLGGLAMVARGVDDVLALAERVRAGTWYGVESPFRLSPDRRAKLLARVERDRLRREEKRSARRRMGVLRAAR